MLKPSLQLKLGQTLTMTPQLQQAIRLLQWQTRADRRIQDGGWNGEGRPISEFADESGQTLREHLLWQLEMGQFSPREAMIGEAVIDAINDDGYLTIGLNEIEEILEPETSVRREEIEAALAKVQRFDPAGIGARSLSECITLQLRQLDTATPGLELAMDLADQHLDLVATREYGELRRSLRTSEETLHDALALIRGCNPRPGQSVSPAAAEYVIPDVFVRKVDNRWQVEISPTGVPKLSVNQQYAKLLRGSGDHAVLRTQLQEARWLIRSLEIRNETLLKVATCIVKRQTDFLDNKYMHTPRGVVEFKYFFSSHLATADGEDQSSTSVRAKIRKLIGAENPAKPLSDSKIASRLADEGIKVARRTVAKYRESMNIASSSERRQRPAR
jgi:RNA polymerase sigma-54 factor